MQRADLLDALDRSTSAFAGLLTAGDSALLRDSPVAACPDWCVLDVAHHLGNIHRWALAATRSDRPPPLGEDAPGLDDVGGWYAAAAADLLDRLRAADPEEPCWHFGAPPRRVGWWVRRQAHETAVHLWDAQDALGTATALDPLLAADGVDEVLDVMVPRQLRLERMAPVAAPIRLVATDAPVDRVLGAGEPSSTVTGTASDLLLALWGRVPLGRLAVDGDPVLPAGLLP